MAEFKPSDGRQTLENDYIEIGKEMRIMLKNLLYIGVRSPVVYDILAVNDQMFIFKMYLASPKLYVMTELSREQLVKSANDLALLPTIVTRLEQVKATIFSFGCYIIFKY